MPLHPQAQALLDQMKAMGFVYRPEIPIAELRAKLQAMLAMRGEPEPVSKVEDRLIPGPAGEIPIRIYTPEGNGPFPVLVFFHTGGWQVGNLDTQDPTCRHLTNLARCIIVSVDYRLAPEHPFPAAPEDCYAATQWVATHAAEFEGDPTRIAIGGDSSGANLATVVAQMTRDKGDPRLAFQLLLFPGTDFRLQTPSMQELAEGYNVTKEMMLDIRSNYVPNEADWTNPLASPLLAPDLSNLPPALIITAEYDPLRDDGELYGKRLQEAGVQTTVTRYDGMIHDFPDMLGELGEPAFNQMASALRAVFS
jgi:acetyl esterase